MTWIPSRRAVCLSCLVCDFAFDCNAKIEKGSDCDTTLNLKVVTMLNCLTYGKDGANRRQRASWGFSMHIRDDPDLRSIPNQAFGMKDDMWGKTIEHINGALGIVDLEFVYPPWALAHFLCHTVVPSIGRPLELCSHLPAISRYKGAMFRGPHHSLPAMF
jgi:hypothetical protein